MKFLKTKPLCFDDVLLVPQYSEVHSRSDVNISTTVAGVSLKVPIISSNMDSVTEAEMVIAMHEAGGLGILHRYMNTEKMTYQLQRLKSLGYKTIPSLGVQQEDQQIAARLKDFGIDTVCIDVAHGDSYRARAMINFCKVLNLKVIAGNVCTPAACKRLIDIGVDVVKCGIGPGSLCSTRLKTGHGYPQFSAVLECAQAIQGQVGLIADGGIRHAGDIVKCLAAGADAVMIGGLFAGCLETPGAIRDGKKVYRGMASLSAQMDRDGRVHNSCPEGESMEVPVRGHVADVVAELAGGIRSGLSYSGAWDLADFRRVATVVQVTPNCTKENGAHGKKE